MLFGVRVTRTPNEHAIKLDDVDPVVFAKRSREMVARTIEVQSRPLQMSEGCKNNMDAVVNMCAGRGCGNLQKSNLTASEYQPLPLNIRAPRCKTLWFAGVTAPLQRPVSGYHMSERSKCSGLGGGYRAEYAAALATQLMNAQDTIQPVLVLAWQGVVDTSDRKHLTAWAERRGVIVLNIDELSFQKELDARNKGRDRLVGAFLRLDIPSLIRKNGLFDLPNICQPEVLYTDSDVLFVNRISAEDMLYVKQTVSKSEEVIVAYGAQSACNPSEIINTGVMIMHVDRFGAEWPQMLEWAMAQPKFPGHDQHLLNLYFAQQGEQMKRRKLAPLPLSWNWKTYWRVPEDTWPEIKVLHTHGPKPETGLWNMADCSFETKTLREGYGTLLKSGICCNHGSVAAMARNIVESVMKNETVCG